MNNENLNIALVKFIDDPFDERISFDLGCQYEQLGQTTSAFSFYLRAAEYGTNNDIIYESLLRMALCIANEGNRPHTLKGILLRAISVQPERPEGYFLLGKVYHSFSDWHEGYAITTIGELMSSKKHTQLITDVGYKGDYCISFHRYVCAWHIGLFDDAIGMMRKLVLRNDLDGEYRKIIQDDIKSFGKSYKAPAKYEKAFHQYLRYKFPGSETIETNHSQCYQDIFVLTMLNGKRNGTFIEIGCDDAYFNSNTALLEKQFGWSGISIDIDPVKIEKFRKERSARTLCQDALTIDFDRILVSDSYDYLQLDCEPAITTFRILKRMPLNRVKFAVVTFEHDNYCDDDKTIKEKARKYLESYGYKLVVNNISEDRNSDFEDWYVHPELVDRSVIEKMTVIDDRIKKVDHYMLNKL